MTYQELKAERFAYEIFFGTAMGGRFCWDEHCAPSYVKRSAPKVLDTIWAMRSSIQEKGAFRHPWDTRESFRNTLTWILRDMFYLGILAKSRGPGEVNGYYLIEQYGANFLCGDVGYGGLPNSAVSSVWQNVPRAGERVAACFDHIERAYRAEMAIDDVAEHATLEERKAYYRNAARAAYEMGYALADQSWAVETVNW